MNACSVDETRTNGCVSKSTHQLYSKAVVLPLPSQLPTAMSKRVGMPRPAEQPRSVHVRSGKRLSSKQSGRGARVF